MTITTQQIEESLSRFIDIQNTIIPFSVFDAEVIKQALHLAKENVWKDMDTAPKNKPILILSPLGDMYVGLWVQHPVTGDEAYLVASGYDDDGNQILVKNPVKWRNIEPPALESVEQKEAE